MASDQNQKDTFISSYYNQSYTYGRQTDFEAEGRQMHLDEIIPADSDERGYLVTDRETGELLYFVNYQADNYQMEAVDIQRLDMIQILLSSNQDLDLFGMIQKNTQVQARIRAKFWGWRCGNTLITPDGICSHDCCYFVFWTAHNCCENISCDQDRCP